MVLASQEKGVVKAFVIGDGGQLEIEVCSFQS
jgi:hypothetical protein